MSTDITRHMFSTWFGPLLKQMWKLWSITPLEGALEPCDDETEDSIRVYEVGPDFVYELPSSDQTERLRSVFAGIKEPSAKEDLLTVFS